jgi:AbrB family looped-hinge helix DNA binding protein
MDNVSVTSKGQVTIPKAVRDVLGIKAGTRVNIAAEGRHAVLTVARSRWPSRVADGPKILAYKGRAATLEEMQQAIIAGAKQSL